MVRASLPKLSGCAVLLALAYAWWGGESEHEATAYPRSGAQSLVDGQAEVATQSNTFPWFASQGDGTRSNVLLHQSSSVDELLLAYQQGGPAPESKHQIRQRLQVLKQDLTARNRMIECFVGKHGPTLAQAMYGVIRDADFKDPGLIESLIQWLSGDAEATLQQRLVDLIADATSSDEGGYSSLIDGYLFQLTQSADEGLRQAAISQRIWYVAKWQPDRLATLAGLLRDPQSSVREEMYGLMESKLGSSVLQKASAAFAPVLSDLLYAPDVVMSERERNRISELLAALNRP